MKYKTKKTYKKTIRFDYFQLTCRTDGQKESEPDMLFGMDLWLNEVNKLGLQERTADYYDESSRLERVKQDDESKYLFLQFNRLRETNLSTKAKRNENSIPTTLEEDEYLGEEVAVLYDDNYYAFMLQRNRHSLSPQGIEEYLNLMWHRNGKNLNTRIFLRPYKWENSVERAKKAKQYRKLSFCIKFAEESNKNINIKSKGLKSLLNGLSEYQGSYETITISLGREKKRSLNQDEISSNISDFFREENKGFFTKALVTKKDTDDAKTETIDLFDDRIHDYTVVEVSEKRSFLLEDFIKPMINLYNYRRTEIASKFMGKKR